MKTYCDGIRHGVKRYFAINIIKVAMFFFDTFSTEANGGWSLAVQAPDLLTIEAHVVEDFESDLHTIVCPSLSW